MKKVIFIEIILAAAVIVGGWYFLFSRPSGLDLPMPVLTPDPTPILTSTPTPAMGVEVNSFMECVEAGYLVMESDPRRCQTPEGLVFVEYEICTQVITPARDPETGEVREFPTPCDVPVGWEVVK